MGARDSLLLGSALALAAILASPARADVTISTDTTQNVSCSGGVCQPTANNAVLNVNDLENLLASGSVEVTTTGSGGVQANNIDVETALSWSTASALSLVARQAITVDQPVSVAGSGGLLITNDGQNEDFSFGSSGNVTFSSLSASLTINGSSYTLVNTVKSLASAISNNPSGSFALANGVDAKKDGTYKQPPVSTTFLGSMEGLGNTIDHMKVAGLDGGLFDFLGLGSIIRNLGLRNVDIRTRNDTGSLSAASNGYVSHCYATGTVKGANRHYSAVGGLVGHNGGTISNSYASAKVTGLVGAYAGGLVGGNQTGSLIESSFATGDVSVTNYRNHHSTHVGGLVGENSSTITNSYSTGAANGGSVSVVGGFAGDTTTAISASYSTGQVHGNRYFGGFVGYDETGGSLDNNYWDTNTSGITNLAQGAGYPSNDPGITGLTTSQLQSGLPAGFDPSVWTENSKINNGLPYLITNPPPPE